MNIVVVYVMAKNWGPHMDYGARFIASYNLNPPGREHRLIVASNGGAPTPDMDALLQTFNHPLEVFPRDGSGWDIGAYQDVARNVPADVMVFFGGSAYVRGPGWLRRVEESVQRHGKGSLYGTMANNGVPPRVFPHVRTTGFWVSPTIMNMYPIKVTAANMRYEFEHGPNCIFEWGKAQGYQTFLVTWDGEYVWPAWESVPNGFHRGDQSNLITGDRLSEPPYYHVP